MTESPHLLPAVASESAHVPPKRVRRTATKPNLRLVHSLPTSGGTRNAAHRAEGRCNERHADRTNANSARTYLSVEQLVALTPWTPDAIEKMVKRNTLKRGIHYFQPQGPRSRLYFKWGAIVEFIEGGSPRSAALGVVNETAAEETGTGATEVRINVEKAETEIQRLLS